MEVHRSMKSLYGSGNMRARIASLVNTVITIDVT